MAKKANVVGKAKGTVNLLAIAVIAVGWLAAVAAITDDSQVQEQAALIKQADLYLEDKIYVRAINKYEEALNTYQTENNLTLERRLLEILEEAGKTVEYCELMEKRIEAGTAQEDEYLALTQYYIGEESYEKAITCIKMGLERFDNEEMKEIYESVRYIHNIRDMNYTIVKKTFGDWPLPAYNGSHWGYITNRGRTSLDFIYEDATRFYEGYAVVKSDGEYILIDGKGDKFAVDKQGLDQVVELGASGIVAIKDGKYSIYSRVFKTLTDETFDCIYLNVNGLYVVQKDGKWAILSSALEPITEYIFDDVAVNSQGQVFSGNFAIVKDSLGYVLINKDGTPMFEERFADAKGYEGGLLAVANESGKWGFVKGDASIVLDFQYEDVHAFSCNLAAVKVDDKWGYINRYNDMIIEPVYEEADPFVAGNALVRKTQNTYELITLKYYKITQ